MELVKKGLSGRAKNYLQAEISKLNEEYSMNFKAIYSLERERVKINMVGEINGTAKYFNVSSYHINDLPKLVRDKYKKFRSLKFVQKNEKQKNELTAIDLPRPRLNFSSLVSSAKSLELQKPLKVIIVEDDFDSVVPVDRAVKSIFSSVSYCMSGAEAVDAISVLEPDLIILDWYLGDSRADVVLEHLDNILWQENQKPVKVITYSGVEKDQINLGHLMKFDRIDHWCKPISIKQMKKRLSSLF